MTDEQKTKLQEKREHPQIMWALWFDNEGCGPHPMGQGCDIYAQWFVHRIDESETRRHAVIAGSAIGGLFLETSDARKLAALLASIADVTCPACGETWRMVDGFTTNEDICKERDESRAELAALSDFTDGSIEAHSVSADRLRTERSALRSALDETLTRLLAFAEGRETLPDDRALLSDTVARARAVIRDTSPAGTFTSTMDDARGQP